MKKLTKEDYINKCNKVHNNQYNYSLVEYKNIRGKINIICVKHGIFEQIAKNHKNGQGCPKCGGRIMLNKEEFIKNSNIKHNNIFSYSLLKEGYIKTDDYIRIINKKNGLIYLQISDHHRSGIKPIKICSISLIEKLKVIHNNLFEYEIKNEYSYSTSKILLINNLTGDKTLYRVDRHLSGMKPNKVTLNYFLYKSNKVHNNRYDYSLITSINGNNDKVNIICKEHGIFNQSVSDHINMLYGCIYCKQGSIGENYIREFLDSRNIIYIKEKRFDTCKFQNTLPFDFYLPKHNICIEFDGQQHFKPIEFFGGQDGFNLTKIRDNIKNQWCLENSVSLIRIKYNQIEEISNILKKQLLVV